MPLSQRSWLVWCALCVLLIWSGVAAAQTPTVLLADNFESYPVGSFPSGWSVYAIGATVTTERAVSPTRSLRLDGTQGLGAFVYHPITISPTAHSVTVEVQTNSMRTDSNNATIRLGSSESGGCGDGAGFQFGPDGRIYAADVPDDQQYILPTSGTYSANVWTQVRVVLDLVTFTYSIAVNGIVVGTGFPHRSQQIPTALCLGSDNNIPAGTPGGTTVYFDDVRVEEVEESTPALLTLPFSVGETWYVCQGYNGQISHQGASALDLSIDPLSPGPTGCGSGPNASTGKPVLAPAAGIVEDHIVFQGAKDILCLNLDGIAIMKVGHLTNLLPIGTRFKQNDTLGIIEPPSKGNGGYAHIHLQIQDLSTNPSCKLATTIPFSGQYRFEEAPDMPYD